MGCNIASHGEVAHTLRQPVPNLSLLEYISRLQRSLKHKFSPGKRYEGIETDSGGLNPLLGHLKHIIHHFGSKVESLTKRILNCSKLKSKMRILK